MRQALAELKRSLESAQHALNGANQSYAAAEQELKRARAKAEMAYDARAANQRNVDRHKAAIAALTEET